MASAYYIPNGPKNLAPLFPGVDFNDLDRYYVEVMDSEGDVVATSNINEIGECCEDDKIRIHFLNSLGAIDAINFVRKNQEHETKSDTRESPTQYPLNKPDHAISRFNVKSNDSFFITCCDYTEEDKEWLDELFDSPIAWMEWAGTQGQEDSYVPIVIIDKKFMKVKQEDRFIYEIDLEIKLSHEKFIIRN